MSKETTDLSNVKPEDIRVLNFTYTPELKAKMEKLHGLNIAVELRKIAEALRQSEALKHGIDPDEIKITIREVKEDEQI